MKNILIALFILMALIFSACSGSNPTQNQPAAEPNNGPGVGRPTPTSEVDTEESFEIPVPYPGPNPTATPYPEGYPVPTIIPTIDPYPENSNTTWILYPVGVQCEDASTSKYQSEQDAEAGLTAAGITVHSASTTELIVCTACGCPTSVHYRIEINEVDLDKAISLGWESE